MPTSASGRYVAPARLDSYWDLMEVKPLFKVPACVVFASRRHIRPVHSLTIRAMTCKGRLPGRMFLGRRQTRIWHGRTDKRICYIWESVAH